MMTYSVLQSLLLLALLMTGAKLGVDALTSGYYAVSCPILDSVVQNVVNQALRKDPSLAAGLLRMHFHDCFVQGCDGSVLIDSTKDNTAEKDSPANQSLRCYEIIDQIKQMVENQCPGVVSCADIVALSARQATFWAGGPSYDLPRGRKDGRRSKIEDTVDLPAPTLNSTALIDMFAKHGFTVQDLVALSGGHTLGVARCRSFKQRLSKFDSANDVDPTMDPEFARTLRDACSGSGSGDAQVALDPTRNSFDNAYFGSLRRRRGVLFSDQTLFAGPRTRSIVEGYAKNLAMFFLDFQRAMIKMGSLDVKEEGSDDGEVRKDCRKIN